MFLIIIVLLTGTGCELFQQEDTTRPTISITSPSSGDTVSGTVTITAEASDNVGVFKVGFRVGSNEISEDYSAP